MNRLLIFFIGFSHFAFSQKFELLMPDQTNVTFKNTMIEKEVYNILNYEYIYNGGGVAIGDINNDGLSDIFFSGNMSPNHLYLNKGNMVFENISKTANIDLGQGINTGVCMADINNDGWIDIYVCKSALKDPQLRTHNLYINNKNNTFTDRAKEFGLDDKSYSTQAYFRDMDLDGDIDMILVNHPYNIGEAKKIILSYDVNKQLKAVEDTAYTYQSMRYYENQNGLFKDKTKEAGLLTHSFGLSAIIADFNNDRYPDIFLCNDYVKPDNLYINQKNGSFIKKTDEYFNHLSFNSMGSDFEDLNNDLFPDLFVVDMLPEENYRRKQFSLLPSYEEHEKRLKYNLKAQFVKNVLQKNNPGKPFSDISYAAGMAFTDWSWAPLIADFNNDGLKDIYITNGYFRDVTDMDVIHFKRDSLIKANKDASLMDQVNLFPNTFTANQYYQNKGNFNFEYLPNNIQPNVPSASNGAAYADLDNDGDLDIIINNINQLAFILKNNTSETTKNHFIRFDLISNKSDNAFGTKIIIETPSGLKQSIDYYPIKGYISSHERFVHFGIGEETKVKATIIWPDGKTQIIDNLLSQRTYKIYQRDALNNAPDLMPKEIKKFEDITKESNIKYIYRDNEYNDFKQEPLIPMRFSNQGPCIAVGDINKDGLEDFYIGGAKDHAANLFTQRIDGTFESYIPDVFEKDKSFEDLGAQFTDIDNDGDLDLIVVSGGNEYPNQIEKYPVRLYLNNGNNNWNVALNFPKLFTSSKTIAINDFNKDGWNDIFIGGNIVAGHYGRIPKSYMILNKNGKFIVDSSNINLHNAGMITDAIWHDINNDGWSDLVVTGHWMETKYFENNNGALNITPIKLSDFGWWNKISIFEKNNTKWLTLGNLGTNSRYKCSSEKPLRMFVNDFDNNGSTDAVIHHYQGDISYPFPIRDVLLSQMVFLKKRFNRYHKYAKATSADVFTAEEMKNAAILKTETMHSQLIKLENGHVISSQNLPDDAQFFPIYGIEQIDIDKNGQQDLLLVGNNYQMDIETGQMDAGIGLILSNNNENWKPIYHHGFYANGDVKTMIPILIKGKKSLLIGKNNGPLQVIQYKD